MKHFRNQIWTAGIFILIINSCHFPLDPAQIDPEDYEPTYLSMSCCQDLKSNHETHICSTIKLYEKIYRGLDYKALDKLNRNFNSKFYIDFNTSNQAEAIRIESRENMEAVQILKPYLEKIISKNPMSLIRLDSIYSHDYLQFEFNYIPHEKDCIQIIKNDSTLACNEIVSNFKTNYKYNETTTKLSLQELINKDEDLIIFLSLNEFPYECYFGFKKPELSFRSNYYQPKRIMRRYQ